MRRSDFPRDRRLFQSMLEAGLVNDNTKGWCHDDMETVTGGRHAREGVIWKPRDAFIGQEQEPYNPSNPVTPTK